MYTYLLYGNYIGADGNKGLLTEGGTNRSEAIHKLANSVGGTVRDIYYAFGEIDVYAIMEVPDQASAAAVSLMARSSGLVTVKSVQLLTPAQIDDASKKAAEYRGPGQ